jgi:hypothetical protein
MTAFYQEKWSSIGIYPGKSSGETVVELSRCAAAFVQPVCAIPLHL